MFSAGIVSQFATKMKRLLLLLPLSLTGCATVTSLDPIPGPLQIKTVDALGVRSSSELSFANVESDAPGSIRGQTLRYRAIKRDGSAYDCTALMIPGMAHQETVFTPPKCVPAGSTGNIQ